MCNCSDIWHRLVTILKGGIRKMSEHIYYTIVIALLMTALGFEIAIYLQ